MKTLTMMCLLYLSMFTILMRGLRTFSVVLFKIGCFIFSSFREEKKTYGFSKKRSRQLTESRKKVNSILRDNS